MLTRIKNWFKSLAGVPALVDRITLLEKERDELVVALLAEKGFNVFAKESTLETKVRVAIRRNEITHADAQNIITLLSAVPAPRVFRIDPVKKKTAAVPQERKGLSSTGR